MLLYPLEMIKDPGLVMHLFYYYCRKGNIEVYISYHGHPTIIHPTFPTDTPL